jgi:hypothetical protein
MAVEWVLAAAAVLAAAVAAVLVLPVRLEAGLAGDGRPRWRAEASALGGLVRLGRDYEGRYWACGPFRRALGPPAAKAENGREAGRSTALKRWDGLPAGERQAVLKLARGLWAATELSVRGDLRYGCEDPAATAWLHALYCAARGAGAAAGLRARPDFLEAGWFGHAAAAAIIRPARAAGPAVRFLIGYAVRRVINKRTGGRRKWLVQT